MPFNTTQYKRRLRAKFGVCPLVGQVTGYQQATQHECQSCKRTFLASPRVMLRHKTKPVCLSCSKKTKIKEQTARASFIARLAAKFPKIRCKKFGKSSTFVCDTCRHTWKFNSENLLQKQHGCPKCAVLEPHKARQRKPSAKAQRYAIDHLTADRVRKINKNPDSVPYTFLGEPNEFYPAAEYGRVVVIAKSAAWVSKNLDRAKAMAKGCHKFGLSLRLLIGGIGDVPAHWMSWRAEDVGHYVAQAARQTIRILALDPGTSNFGWSVLEVQRPFKVSLLASGLIERPMTEMAGSHFGDQIEALLDEISEITQEFGTCHLIAERYMARGMKGSTIELVNCMLGALVARSGLKSQNVKLLPAAQWKNEFNRIYNLEEFYKSVNCVDHQADASLIGLYGAHVWYGVKPFTGIAAKVFAKQLNTHNLEPRRTK